MAAYFHLSDSEIISGYKRYSQQRNLDLFMALNLQKGSRDLSDGHSQPEHSVQQVVASWIGKLSHLH